MLNVWRTPNMPSSSGDGFIINPAQIVASGVSQGLSGRSIIKLLRDNGAGRRDSVVYKMIGEIRAAIDNRPMVQGMSTNVLPTGDQYAKWTTARTGYSTQMKLVTRDRDTGLIGTSMTSYTTRDPHTIDEAIANKMADLEVAFEGDDAYDNQDVLGVLPWNIFEMGPE